LKKSQIEEFIDFYEGAGCQHIAVATDNIVFTVSEMRKRGVEFLHVPGAYYDTVAERVGIIDEDLARLKELGEAYREVMGRNFPAMTCVEVSALVEERAKVEIEVTAVVPD
jgi:cystathionine beta-lyase family protein involved in aluminum resistance